MIEQQVNIEGHEPCSIHSVRFGRHPADANVSVLVPKYEAAVNFTLSPAAYMCKDFMENYLQYVCVVTSKRKLTEAEAGEAVILAKDLVNFTHVMPKSQTNGDTADFMVLYSDNFPSSKEMEAKGIFSAGLLIVIEADAEAFQQTVNILKMAGLAAMAGGKMNEQPAKNDDASEVSKNIVGRRLSDAMPPNNSKH